MYETIIMETRGDHITPLLTNPGLIVLTSTLLYFQPFNNVETVSFKTLFFLSIKEEMKRLSKYAPIP